MSETTKRALETSLKHLLLQKPLNRITINDIATDCGISRMTFYYHFQSIYDLVEWACVEDASKALENKRTYDSWQQGFLQIFQVVEENKPFIMNAYHSINRMQVEDYLYRLTSLLLLDVVDELSKDMKVRDEDKAFIADFYKYGFVGLMLEWIDGGMEEKPEKIISRLDVLIHGTMIHALENYRTDKPQNNSSLL